METLRERVERAWRDDPTAFSHDIAARVGCGKTAVVKFKPRDLMRGAGRPQQRRASTAMQSPARLPDPAPEAGGPSLPDACVLDYSPHIIDTVGVCGILGDVHIPYHDKPTIERWVDECKRSGAKTLLLNGDVLDCYQVSDHYRDPSKPRMREEIERGRQFLEYLRSQFPRTRIVFKEGNHDERFKRYLATRAPEVFDLEDVWLPNLLRASALGIEWVADKRVVMVGKLPVIHGHEYRGGGGVQPSRWLYLRTGDSALTGHFHRTDHYTYRTVTDKEIGMWSVGCACHLKPAYAPLNQWTHGYAMCEVGTGGEYHVHNRRILKDGRVV